MCHGNMNNLNCRKSSYILIFCLKRVFVMFDLLYNQYEKKEKVMAPGTVDDSSTMHKVYPCLLYHVLGLKGFISEDNYSFYSFYNRFLAFEVFSLLFKNF